ncbi:hypothetical protein Tco_0537076, partial [Tanacetum coccineum]
MSAKSKIINNVMYITAKVAGKHVSISEASIRSDLLFDDADGIDSLPNQAIFDVIQLMGVDLKPDLWIVVLRIGKLQGIREFSDVDFISTQQMYALTENPTIYVFFIKQFWKTTTARTSANGEVELTATIDGQVKTIIEASIRIHLKLEDNGGITTLPNSEIFEQLALMG